MSAQSSKRVKSSPRYDFSVAQKITTSLSTWVYLNVIDNLTKKRVVVKRFNNEYEFCDKDIFGKNVITEIACLKRLNHDNIIKLQDIYIEDKTVNLVTEQFDCNLTGLKCTKRQLKDIIFQIFTGLAYIHANQIIHRDIKPENIFIKYGTNPRAVIADFDMARIYTGENEEYKVGTPSTIAPEILDGYINYDYSVDIWSLGVTICYLLSGTKLFGEEATLPIIVYILGGMTDEEEKYYSELDKQELR